MVSLAFYKAYRGNWLDWFCLRVRRRCRRCGARGLGQLIGQVQGGEHGDARARGDGADGEGQWGWGEPLAVYFDNAKVNLVNRAVGGTGVSHGH